MKKFAQQFGKSAGKSALTTIKVATIGTIGLASAVGSLATSTIVAGCNTGIKKLNGKKARFKKELRNIHDIREVANKIVDGRISLEEAYDSMVSDEFKIMLDFLREPYRKASMDINQAKG